MKRFICLLALLGVSTYLLAGEIYGTLRIGNRPVPAGLEITINVGGVDYCTQTDAHGAFRVRVGRNGPGVLKVDISGAQASIRIYSSPRPRRYDLELYTAGREWRLRLR